MAPLGSVDVDVLANDHGGDAGFAPATSTISQPVSHGLVAVVGDVIRYTAGAGFTGTDTFSYLVCTTDRQRCVEGHATVNAQAIPFQFRPPVRNHLNLRQPASGVPIRFRTPMGKAAFKAAASVAVDCASGQAIGGHEPVVAPLHTNAHRRGEVWFRWATSPTWRGCRDLEISLIDGTIHTAHYRWRPLH